MANNRSGEFVTVYHMLFLIFFSLLGVLLDISIVLSDWGRPFFFLVLGGIIFVWAVHISGVGSDRTRMYLYVFTIIIVMLRYAFVGITLTDIPSVLCILIILLSVQEDFKLVCITALSYVADILINIFFTRYININSGWILFERLALGCACITGSCLISRYLMNRNITLNRDLQDKEERLERSQKENELFLSNMSHELRTPINAVGGVSEIILSKNPDSELERNVRIIQRAGKRLHRQVSNMLYFSEIKTGHFKLTNDEYELLSVVNDAVNDAFALENENELDFFIDVKSSLPRTLYGDATRIRKVLYCLLDNSIKFTKEGGGYLLISGREEQYGINLNIDIYDMGSGMSPEQINRAFDGVSMDEIHSERENGGLGLGLAIAHGIISNMGGFIGIESKPGEGTHVHVSIPQEIRNSQHIIDMPERSKYRVLCYFNREKYPVLEVSGYTLRFMDTIKNDLIPDIRQVTSLEEVKDLCASERLTHLFIGEWEYDMDRAFFEEQAKKISVCVHAGKRFTPAKDSSVTVLRKPIFILSVVNYLKATLPGEDGRIHENTADTVEADTGDYRRVKALVVDDDRMNLVVAKGMLESIGLSCEICENGFQAIEKCSISDYDIIFMDYMMPQMNGYSAMLRIREVRNRYYDDKPIVVLTANAVSGAKEEFLKQGFDEFISKPVEIKVLKKTVDRLCRGIN